MRYFTKELWSRINSQDKSIRLNAEKEWTSNSLAYQQKFAEIRKHLPPTFIKSYLSRNGLHDYIILGMTITKRERAYSCEVQLTNDEETVLIVISGIKALQVSIESFLCCLQGRISWGYSEFEITPNHTIKLAVLCDVQNEMLFEFEKIKLICQ